MTHVEGARPEADIDDVLDYSIRAWNLGSMG